MSTRLDPDSLYKVLYPGRYARYATGFVWPQKWHWTAKIPRLVECKSGYHLCSIEQLLSQWLPRGGKFEVWRVEIRGRQKACSTKTVVQQARLVELIASVETPTEHKRFRDRLAKAVRRKVLRDSKARAAAGQIT
jgi:hypothetical protein